MPTNRSHRRLPVAAVAACAAAMATAAPASAAPFDCSASAIRGTVLTHTGLEPVRTGGEGCPSNLVQLDDLPAPLSGIAVAKTELVGPADDVTRQRAGAIAGVASFSVGSLRSLPIALPQARVPSGLEAVRVELPTTIGPLDLPSGLPAQITVDASEAARRLVPERRLPDVPLAAVRALRSLVGGQCIGGIPSLTGFSAVDGLTGVGEALPVDQAVDRVVTLLNAQTIPLTGIDLSKVVLPAGLSFDDPLTGAILRDAVGRALAALPPIEVPAAVADVETVPAERISEDGALEQRALRMKVAVAGQQVADLVMGIARVATNALDCSPRAAFAPAPEADTPVAAASQLAVSCGQAKVTLIDVADRRRHVALRGAADQRFIGRTVSIVFTETGKRVATATVRPNGFFRARAPLPSEALRYTSRARYMAVIDDERSLPLKLHRRMRIGSLDHRGEKVVLKGRILGPMVDGAKVEVRRRISCTKDVVVGRIRPRSDGTWRAVVKAPRGSSPAAVYRATTVVRPENGSMRRFPTFTLPGYVSLG